MIPYTTLDSIIAQMPERTGHTLLDEDQSPHGRLMELDRLALPKLTPAQWVLHTAPE